MRAKEIQAFQCNECSEVYVHKMDAISCCTCRLCNSPHDPGGVFCRKHSLIEDLNQKKINLDNAKKDMKFQVEVTNGYGYAIRWKRGDDVPVLTKMKRGM